MSCEPEELLEIQFAHRAGCLGSGGERAGAEPRGGEVLEGLAFVCSGEAAPAGVDALSWVPEATAHLLDHPELFERPPFVGGIPPLEVMLRALVTVVDDLTAVSS